MGRLGKVPEHQYIYRSQRLCAQRKERVCDSDERLTASQKHGIVTQEAFMQAEGRAVVKQKLCSQHISKAEITTGALVL